MPSLGLAVNLEALKVSLAFTMLNSALPFYHPKFRRKLTSLTCDDHSTVNKVWDGSSVD